MHWPLQDAKNRFSDLIRRAREIGPQTVTLRGARAAVVVSADHYDSLVAGKASLADHLLAGPNWDEEMAEAVNAREKTPSRDPLF